MSHSSNGSHGNSLLVALQKSAGLAAGYSWGVMQKTFRCWGLAISNLFGSNSLKNSYFLLYFYLSWNSGGFFPQIFQTQDKADRVTMCSLAVNGLGKAFKIVSTI